MPQFYLTKRVFGKCSLSTGERCVNRLFQVNFWVLSWTEHLGIRSLLCYSPRECSNFTSLLMYWKVFPCPLERGVLIGFSNSNFSFKISVIVIVKTPEHLGRRSLLCYRPRKYSNLTSLRMHWKDFPCPLERGVSIGFFKLIFTWVIYAFFTLMTPAGLGRRSLLYVPPR